MPRPAKYANAAERQAAYRARKGNTVTLYLSPELVEAVDAYIARQARDGDVSLTTRSAVVEKLVRTQLLRKR